MQQFRFKSERFTGIPKMITLIKIAHNFIAYFIYKNYIWLRHMKIDQVLFNTLGMRLRVVRKMSNL